MGYSTPSLVRFEQLFDPRKKTCFEKLVGRFRMKTLLFPRLATAKNPFVLHSTHTGDNP